MPNVFILAGPNGVGKTTYARRFLAREMKVMEFLNADLIAAGISPFAPEKAAFDAGRLMHQRLRDLVAQRKDFSFETTLSGRAYLRLVREFRAAGYRIRLDFLWVPSLSITRDRVRERVAKGGHNIPDDIQQRRFHLGIRHLATLYRPLLDHWRLLDNIGPKPHLIVEERMGQISVVDPPSLAKIEEYSNVRFMPEISEGGVQEPSEIPYDEETRAAIRALRMAFADAVLDNLRYGLPITQWRDGQVVKVPAEELAPLARRILESNGEPLPEER